MIPSAASSQSYQGTVCRGLDLNSGKAREASSSAKARWISRALELVTTRLRPVHSVNRNGRLEAMYSWNTAQVKAMTGIRLRCQPTGLRAPVSTDAASSPALRVF